MQSLRGGHNVINCTYSVYGFYLYLPASKVNLKSKLEILAGAGETVQLKSVVRDFHFTDVRRGGETIQTKCEIVVV